MNLTLNKGDAIPLTVESSWLFVESYHILVPPSIGDEYYAVGPD